MNLSDRLREAMAYAGINQRELAQRCGVSAPSVNGWLSGKAKFLRGENLLAAATVLDVSDQWLATGKGAKTRKTSAVADERGTYDAHPKLDVAIVFDVARALHEAHEELGLSYDFSENPQLFIDAYHRAATYGNFSEGRGSVWLGSHISRAQTEEQKIHGGQPRAHAKGVHKRTVEGRSNKA